MRVLVTNQRLDQRAGSDLFVRDLARGLQRRGHFVLTYSSDTHERRRLLESDLIPVATDLRNLPFRPDIIHSRHHLDAMTAVMSLPGVPAIHHCLEPTSLSFLPRHPRIYRYVAPSPGIAQRMAAEDGEDEPAVDVLANAVDLERFATVREPSKQPTRALVYDDHHRPESALVIEIRRATDRLGLELDLIGRRLGRSVDDPEKHLPAFDVVFAAGRKALEALACGCAVIVLGAGTCGELVGEEDFDRLRDADLSAPPDAPAPSARDIQAEIMRYSPASCLAISERVRRTISFVPFVARLESIYQDAVALNAGRDVDPAAERDAAFRYLRRLAPAIKEMGQVQRTEGDMARSSASTWLDVSAKLTRLQTAPDSRQW